VKKKKEGLPAKKKARSWGGKLKKKRKKKRIETSSGKGKIRGTFHSKEIKKGKNTILQELEKKKRGRKGKKREISEKAEKKKKMFICSAKKSNPLEQKGGGNVDCRRQKKRGGQ